MYEVRACKLREWPASADPMIYFETSIGPGFLRIRIVTDSDIGIENKQGTESRAKTGTKTQTRTRLEIECASGIRINNATGIIIRKRNGNGNETVD
ncbi:hypothetical protein EVAR_36235_1 [Eumeta japonica]|uniref:Uncharacterized protein n=1 Tax=Eumeta variegata TaxID=151549 RepID=A0A4C1WXW2_EUMVA|nr:hypothetical protein EVAR_36235_1 [Eumeta japonica]